MADWIKFNGMSFDREQFKGCSLEKFTDMCMQWRFFREIPDPKRSEKIKEAFEKVVPKEAIKAKAEKIEKKEEG